MALAAEGKSETLEIARGLRGRDLEVINALVAQYHYRLVRYLIYLTGTREDVDDLVQETWLRILERGRTYDGHSRFEPWLFAIARNLTLDHLRKRRVLSLDVADEESSAVPLPAGNEPSPFAMAARTEDARRLAHAMQTLDVHAREVLVLRFQEELSLQEVANVVGAPVSTVASRIYRGLQTLRAELEGGPG